MARRFMTAPGAGVGMVSVFPPASLTKLDDLAAPDNNTDLNATAAAHGLCPRLSGTASDLLKGDGSWGTPKLDTLGTPDDNTNLNASSTRHGLMPKLTGNSGQLLRGDGSWATGVLNNTLIWTRGPQTIVNNVGNFSVGSRFVVMISGAVLTGITFQTARATNTTFRCILAKLDTATTFVHIGSIVTTVDVPTTGAGVYTGTFASPYSVLDTELGSQHFAALVWDTDATVGNKTNANETTQWFGDLRYFVGVVQYTNRPKFYITGEAAAGGTLLLSATAMYPVDIIAI